MSILHRYSSTIHGNYRRAYMQAGLLLGVLLALYVLLRMLMGSPLSSPFSLVSDLVLLVAIFLLTAFYRQSLPDKRITLKEAMLFGMGTAVVSGLVYGLLLWGIGLLFPAQTVLFTNSITGSDITSADPQIHYWALWWSMLSCAASILLGSFGAFVSAIFFRNEKSDIKTKQ